MRLRMKALLAPALALFGATAIAQEKWTIETQVDDFDDSVTVSASLYGEAGASMAVGCQDGQPLTVAIDPSERLQPSLSEEVEIRFDDETIERISVLTLEDVFGLSDNEEFSKLMGNYEPLPLARRLAKHSKFRLRNGTTTLTFEYDKDSAKKAIGDALRYCGYRLEQRVEDETTVAPTATAQLQWTVETTFDVGIMNVHAVLEMDADTKMAVICIGGEHLTAGISQSEHMQERTLEDVEVRFGDEEIETISVGILGQGFFLSDHEEIKEYGNYSPVELARRFANGKFWLRYEDVVLTFDYDKASAKEAIGEVLEHCGYELERQAEDDT